MKLIDYIERNYYTPRMLKKNVVRKNQRWFRLDGEYCGRNPVRQTGFLITPYGSFCKIHDHVGGKKEAWIKSLGFVELTKEELESEM